MAAKTWDGGGADNNWSTAGNWNLDTVPVTTDTITFDGTSSKNCTIDALGTWSGGTVTVAGTYTGSITQNVSMTTAAWSWSGNNVGQSYTQAGNLTTTTFAFSGINASYTISGSRTFQCSTMSLSSGTFSFSSASSMICTGNVSMSGTTPTGPASVNVTAPSGTWEMRGNFTCTYSLVDNTYLDFNPNGGTIDFNGTALATIDVPDFVIGFSYNAVTFNKTAGGVNISTNNVVPLGASPTTNFGSSVLTVTGEVTVSGTWTHNGALTLASSGGTVSGALTALTITGSFTATSGAVFPASTPVAFTPSPSSVTINCSAITFGTCTVNSAGNQAFSISGGTTIPLGASPSTDTGTAIFTVNGTLTLSGTWTHEGQITVGSTGTVSGALTSIVLNSTANTAFTITAGGTFPASVAGTVNSAGLSFTAAGITFGVWDLNMTTDAVGVTIAVNTTMPLGANAVSNGALTINGTVTATGTWTHSGTITTGASSTITGPVQIVMSEANFTMNATGTLSGGVGVTMTFTSGTGRTFAGGGKTYTNLTRAGAGSGTLTITGTNTFTEGIYDTVGAVAHTIIFPNVTTTVGDFRVNGSSGKLVTLARTGGAGTFTLTKTGAGDVNQVHHISVSNSTVDAAPVWYAGVTPPSVDGGGNTNWVFTAAPDAAKIRKGAILV